MTETLAPLTVPEADPALLDRLHARLEAAAVGADAPDVHYRRIDSPLGRLLVLRRDLLFFRRLRALLCCRSFACASSPAGGTTGPVDLEVSYR